MPTPSILAEQRFDDPVKTGGAELWVGDGLDPPPGVLLPPPVFVPVPLVAVELLETVPVELEPGYSAHNESIVLISSATLSAAVQRQQHGAYLSLRPRNTMQL